MNEPWADVPSRDWYLETYGEAAMWRYRVAVYRWQCALVAHVEKQDAKIAELEAERDNDLPKGFARNRREDHDD